MNNTDVSQQQAVNEFYNFAANLLVNENKSSIEVKNALKDIGLSEDAAYTIVSSLEVELKKAKKDRAGKDILY